MIRSGKRIEALAGAGGGQLGHADGDTGFGQARLDKFAVKLR